MVGNNERLMPNAAILNNKSDSSGSIINEKITSHICTCNSIFHTLIGQIKSHVQIILGRVWGRAHKTAPTVMKKSDIITLLLIWIFPAKIGLVGGHEYNIYLCLNYHLLQLLIDY